MSKQETKKESTEKKKLSQKELNELYKEMDFNCEYTDNIPAILKQLKLL